MSRTVSASQARAGLPQILERVNDGEEVIITRHGKPVAVVVRPDTLNMRRAEAALNMADDVRQLLVDAGGRSLDSAPALSERRAEELVDDVRAGRTGR